MARLEGSSLYHAVACRVLARFVSLGGASAVEVADPGGQGEGVDIVGTLGGSPLKVKVKADSYCGTDPEKIADRSLAFYRRQGSDYAFEAVSHSVTRRPGWIFHSDALELYYYFLALGQPAAEVAALMEEPDGVFFGELRVERDDLHVMRMGELREWFEQRYEQYTPRPVLVGDHSAWFRIVPRDELRRAIPIRVVGPVFASVSRP